MRKLTEIFEKKKDEEVDAESVCEKLKLIIVDRIKSNICKLDINLGLHSFGGNHVEIHRDDDYDPNNHCCRGC